MSIDPRVSNISIATLFYSRITRTPCNRRIDCTPDRQLDEYQKKPSDGHDGGGDIIVAFMSLSALVE